MYTQPAKPVALLRGKNKRIAQNEKTTEKVGPLSKALALPSAMQCVDGHVSRLFGPHGQITMTSCNQARQTS